ncbi:hypothetical protein GWI33_010545 [Rhynchophorus ferrugineus]|uniref:E3 ubiquitin-protein ligase n=1 Tax=Rhynchophorus ferrugineus TaxID=354439 RepID=A0A834IQN3_RHYFE|nr:hypothetical protein GWI33_010545 [Rhynchophorus ferrugineus]
MATSSKSATSIYLGQLRSTGNIDKLKCSSCGKYLSLGPVSSSVDCFKNFCGRCLPVVGMQRNILYEELAKHVLFPCSISSECKTTVKFNDIRHEFTCLHRLIECPMNKCKSQLTVGSLVEHFRTKHTIKKALNHVFSVDLTLPLTLMFNMCWMFEDEEVVYFLQVFANKYRFGVNVFNMSPSQEIQRKRFAFTMKIGDRRINFPQTQVVKQFPWNKFKKNQQNGIVNWQPSVLKTLEICGVPQTRQMRFSLKIYSLNDSKSFSNIMHDDCPSIVSGYLKCSACHRSHSSYMMCNQGHIICLACTKSDLLCEICNESYVQHFNPLTIISLSILSIVTVT